MENCIVCLKANEDILSRITITSAEWVKNKMQKIIEKHLWWWYLKTVPGKNINIPWICQQCWREICSFHNFYKNVERAHQNYQSFPPLLNSVKKEQEMSPANIKTAEVFETNSDLLLIKENFQKHNNNAEKIIDIKVEYCDSPLNRSSTERSIDLNTCDDNSYDVKVNTERDSKNINIWESNPLERIKSRIRTKQKSNTNQRKKVNSANHETTKKEKHAYKINHVDNFFQENQHNLECCFCNVTLPDFRSIRSHCRNEHNIPGYVLCCGKKFYKRCLLVDHLRVHKDPNFFSCETCTKTFITRRGLELHVKTHEVRERNFKCDECGKSYFKLNVYERHKLIHVPDDEKKYECSQCDKKFGSKDLRQRHEYSAHVRKNPKICDICGKSFCYGDSFLRHMEEHAGIPQSMVTCHICGLKLTNKYGLRQHIKIRHVEENLQEQICPYCSRVSPNLNAHRKHIKYSHTMQRNHACHLCEKAFRRPLELKEHLSTHTGEALYTCPHCPRTFISNANMHKHRKTAHRMEWEETRLNKFNESRGKNVQISPTISNATEAVQNDKEKPTLPTTDSYVSSFTKYLQNIDN